MQEGLAIAAALGIIASLDEASLLETVTHLFQHLNAASCSTELQLRRQKFLAEVAAVGRPRSGGMHKYLQQPQFEPHFTSPHRELINLSVAAGVLCRLPVPPQMGVTSLQLLLGDQHWSMAVHVDIGRCTILRINPGQARLYADSAGRLDLMHFFKHLPSVQWHDVHIMCSVGVEVHVEYATCDVFEGREYTTVALPSGTKNNRWSWVVNQLVHYKYSASAQVLVNHVYGCQLLEEMIVVFSSASDPSRWVDIEVEAFVLIVDTVRCHIDGWVCATSAACSHSIDGQCTGSYYSIPLERHINASAIQNLQLEVRLYAQPPADVDVHITSRHLNFAVCNRDLMAFRFCA